MPADIKKKMIERTVIGLIAMDTLKVAGGPAGVTVANQLLLELEPDAAKREKITARLKARASLMMNRKPSRQAVAA